MKELAIFGGTPAAEPVPDSYPVSDAEIAAVTRSLRETPLTTLYGTHDVARFEEAFATRFRLPHCVAVTSGTAALHAAVAALGIGPGDEVITTPYSFVASVSVIVQQGATPVFCDLEPATLGLDVDRVAAAITPRTRAVIAVHIYGMPMRIAELAELCRAREIALIEDCAGAAGARVGDRYVGSFGDLGCFSFNVHKVIRTGEGGMVSTTRADLAGRLRALRVNGLSPGGGVNNVGGLGFNYTMAQPLAALGCAQMAVLDGMLEQRARNRDRLMVRLAGVPITMLRDPPHVTSVGYWTPLLLAEHLLPMSESIVWAANAEGIDLHPGYNEPLHHIAYLRPFAVRAELPVCEALWKRVLVIDPSPWLTEAHMDQIADGMHKVFDNLDRVAAAWSERLKQQRV